MILSGQANLMVELNTSQTFLGNLTHTGHSRISNWMYADLEVTFT